MPLGDLGSAAADLILGSSCVSCRRPGPALCLSCGSVLAKLPTVCWPTPCPPGLPVPFAVAAYEGAAKAVVVAHKEHAVLSLAPPLGRALALSVMGCLAIADGCPTGGVLLVSPPASEAVVRRRGHDPLQRVVKVCLQALRSAGVPAAPGPGLVRMRGVVDQAGLSAADRAANLEGAFEVGRRSGYRNLSLSRASAVAGSPVVVVDDVLTTGATAVEVTRAVGQTGAAVLGVAVVAATRRRSIGDTEEASTR